MWQIDIPGFKYLEIENLIFDFNGTLAIDGALIPGVKEILTELSQSFHLFIVTADTFGKAAEQAKEIPCKLEILPAGDQAKAKRQMVRKLGQNRCIAVGNGRNDQLMLEEAAIGIVVLQEEGASTATLLHADVVCRTIFDALNLLKYPRRLIATLRA
jgi:P-type E1-E2 ATPase